MRCCSLTARSAEARINTYSQFQLRLNQVKICCSLTASCHATSALRLAPKLFYNHLVVLIRLLYSIGHYPPEFKAFLCLPNNTNYSGAREQFLVVRTCKTIGRYMCNANHSAGDCTNAWQCSKWSPKCSVHVHTEGLIQSAGDLTTIDHMLLRLFYLTFS